MITIRQKVTVVTVVTVKMVAVLQGCFARYRLINDTTQKRGEKLIIFGKRIDLSKDETKKKVGKKLMARQTTRKQRTELRRRILRIRAQRKQVAGRLATLSKQRGH